MNLDNVTVEMRPRSEWEAADFGVRMVRRDAAAIYRVWFAITLPLLALTLIAVAYSPYPLFATFLYWWLEPLADGPVLRIISRRLFGEDANVRASLRTALIIAWRNRIFLLSPYRFHFARSIAMPLTQLEGLSGAARKARARVLNKKIMNHGTGVTVAYQHLAIALYLGVILVGFAFIPTTYQGSIGEDWMGLFWQNGGRTTAMLSLLTFYVAQSALQPWFVGAGFGLYINCRTQLEAWDIEVAFRRMVQRRNRGLATAALIVVLVAPFAFLGDRVLAQDSAGTAPAEVAVGDPGFSGFWSDEEIDPVIRQVVLNEALSTTRQLEQWRSIDADKSDPADDGASNWFLELMRGAGRILAYVIEFGLWIVVALLLYVAFATRDKWMPYLGPVSRTNPANTRILLAGGELTAESLPDDVPAETLRLWNNGDKRKALGLLYRGSVFSAVTRHGVRIPPSATEGACVNAVSAQTSEQQSAYFHRVVMAWIRCAYGYCDVDDDIIQPLCNEWSRHYGDVK